MRLTVTELRATIREELLRGVPDFALREAANKFIRELKSLMVKYVNTSPGDSTPVDRADALRAIDLTLGNLELEIHELLEDRIYGFLQQM